jgi:hypothetical protein
LAPNPSKREEQTPPRMHACMHARK